MHINNVDDMAPTLDELVKNLMETNINEEEDNGLDRTT